MNNVTTRLLLMTLLLCNTHALLPPLSIQADSTFSNNFKFKGINWFGFNNDQTMVDGLWAGGSQMATDFNTIVYRIKLLGFNSIRLPFTYTDLNLKPTSKVIPCNIETLQVIQKTTINPYWRSPIFWWKCPAFQGSLPTKSPCNTYLATNTTLHRFTQVIQTFVDNDFYVVLDYHPMGKERQADNMKAFSESWLSLAKHLYKYPTLRGRIIFDLMNEPDSMRKGWKEMTPLYLKTMDLIYNLWGKSALFMIEGTGQVQYNLNWGDGFVTNTQIIKKYSLSDPNDFFRAIINKPYLKNIIISPHMYGPSVSKNNRHHKGILLWTRMNESFGYLANQGYCTLPQKSCYKFPIVMGEFGSEFITKDDIDHLEDFAFYMQRYLDMNWMFWAYNRNSGDTGGIVKDNWKDFEWGKLEWLRRKMALKPWYI